MNMLLNILLYGLIGSFSLGQLGRISYFHQEVNLYFYEIIVGCFIIVSVAKYKRKVFTAKYGWQKYAVYFLVSLLISLLLSLPRFNMFQNIVAGLYFLRLVFYFVFFVYLNHHLEYSKKAHTVIWRGLYAFITITVITSLIQYFFYPNIANLLYLGWDPHLYRLVGTFFEPAISAALYGLIALILFYSNLPKAQKYIYTSIALVSVLFTYSRGAYLGIIAIVLWIVLRKTKRGLIYSCLFILLFVFAINFLPKRFGEGVNLLRTSTIVSRLDNYQEAIKIWSTHPVMGVGYNHIRYVRSANTYNVNLDEASHSGASFHSSFLVILVTGGIISLIFFILFLLQFVKIHEATMLGVLYLTILSLTDNILLHPFVLLLFFTVVSLFDTSPSKS